MLHTDAYSSLPEAYNVMIVSQNNPYWSVMHANTYKYGFSGAESNFYYSFDHAYDLNGYTHRVDEGRRVWDNPATPITNAGSPHASQGHSPSSNSSSEERK